MSIKHLTFDDSGILDFYQLTNVFQTLLTLSDDTDILWLGNSTDTTLIFRVPSGRTTKQIYMLAGSAKCIDARGNSKRVAKGLIEVRYILTVPTTGSVEATAAR